MVSAVFAKTMAGEIVPSRPHRRFGKHDRTAWPVRCPQVFPVRCFAQLPHSMHGNPAIVAGHSASCQDQELAFIPHHFRVVTPSPGVLAQDVTGTAARIPGSGASPPQLAARCMHLLSGLAPATTLSDSSAGHAAGRGQKAQTPETFGPITGRRAVEHGNVVVVLSCLSFIPWSASGLLQSPHCNI